MPSSLPANVYPIIAVGGEPAPVHRSDALAKQSDGTRILVTHVDLPDVTDPRLVLLRDPTSPRAHRNLGNALSGFQVGRFQ